MSYKIKNIVVTSCFFVFIFAGCILNVITPDKEISKSERRKLEQISDINAGNFTEKFEDYSLDQFFGRDFFRKIKAYVTYNIFNQKDNNKIYIVDGQVSKYNDFLYENSIVSASQKFNKLYEKYLRNMNVYYSIIPDKNYFIAEENGYPAMNYEKLVNLMKDNVKDEIKYIDLFNEININDYYATDIHWRQEKLDGVVNKLADEMGFVTSIKPGYSKLYGECMWGIEYNSLNGFYGNYYGQSALPINSEELIYCKNDAINSAKVYILDETSIGKTKEDIKFEETTVYNLEAYDGIDPYDIYLSGAKPLIVIENEKSTTDKELIIFRDSYGSSLAPLLIESYKKITLIDLRYISNKLFEAYELVEFKDNQDVLIVNCVDVLNNSTTLKVY